jgi:hypothetical protein
MDADLAFTYAIMDVINEFNELERQAMMAAIVANTRLHCVLPLYDMFYTDMEVELWYFDEDVAASHAHSNLGEGLDMDAYLSYSSSALLWPLSTRRLSPNSVEMGCSSPTRTTCICMGHRRPF